MNVSEKQYLYQENVPLPKNVMLVLLILAGSETNIFPGHH